MTGNQDYNELKLELIKYNLPFSGDIDGIEELKAQLTLYINELINNNFSLLISLLYRLDISETKLKQALSNSGDVSSATIITEMIVERQFKKLETRKALRKDDKLSDEERW